MDPALVVPTPQALSRYPVLSGLLALAGAEWTFQELDDADGLTALYGNRQYRAFGQIDAMKVLSETEARAQRTKLGDGLLKQFDGTLADTVDFLLNLPHPSSPLAPHLILGAMPQKLWTPSQRL